MKSLFLAIQFLTIFPVKIKDGLTEKSYARSTIFFPVVGLFLGGILALTNNLLTNLLPDYLLSVVIVFLLVILTGGLHLDGFADTIDAFYAGKDKDDILRIMRDSQVGTMGVLGLLGLLLLKIGFLNSLPLKFESLLIMPVLSRWSMVLVMFLFNYSREEGKAKYFFEGMNWKIFLVATLITSICAVFVFGFKGLYLLGLVALATFIFGEEIKRRIEGLTGDTLGAINEINEVLILVFLYFSSVE